MNRSYVRYRLSQLAETGEPTAVQGAVGFKLSAEERLRKGISSQEAERVILAQSQGIKAALIRYCFAHKERLKKVLGLGSWLLARKDRILQNALDREAETALDLSDCIGWYRDDFVAACYQRLLGRAPDASGKGTYEELSRQGAGNEVIAYAIATSVEFGNRAQVHDLDIYHHAYQKFVRRRRLKKIPILGRVISLLAVPGQLERLYTRLERTENALTDRSVNGALATEHRLDVLHEDVLKQGEQIQRFTRVLQTQQSILIKITQQMETHEAQVSTLRAQTETQTSQISTLRAQAETHEAQVSALRAQAETQAAQLSEGFDSQTALVSSLSAHIDNGLEISTSVSEKLDALPAFIRNQHIASHTAVAGFPGGVVGVIVDEFFMGIPSEEWGVAMYLSIYGHFEKGSETFFMQQLRSDMTVLDLGANLGIYTLRALRKGCNVWSYEPTPHIFQILKQNVKANGFAESGRAHLMQMAVSNTCGTTRFYPNKEMCGHNSLFPTDAQEFIEVETVALDRQLELLPNVDFIKMDIEGAEYLALQGMRQLLQQNPQVKMIMEFAPIHICRAGAKPEEVLFLLDELGLVWEKINEETGDLEPISKQALLETDSVNLYLKRGEAV